MSLSDELEIIRASLLPSEELIYLSPHTSTWLSAPADGSSTDPKLEDPSTPFLLEIKSSASSYRIHIEILKQDYYSRKNVKLQIKSSEMGREEALGWGMWVEERLDESWDEGVETSFPLYHVLTTHLLPNLQDHSDSHPTPAPINPSTTHSHSHSTRVTSTYTPSHILFTSHHLLAPSKRRNLSSLSSSLRLQGFAKVGHPGLIYAEGDLEDLEEFGREVKGWQWLNLRMRVLEEDETGEGKGKGKMGGTGQEEGRRKGEWMELGKVGEAVDYLRERGKERLLLDIGIGAGGNKA